MPFGTGENQGKATLKHGVNGPETKLKHVGRMRENFVCLFNLLD